MCWRIGSRSRFTGWCRWPNAFLPNIPAPRCARRCHTIFPMSSKSWLPKKKKFRTKSFTITKLSEHKHTISQNYIYSFNTFDQIASIFPFIDKNSFSNIYTYNNKFYLIIDKNNKVNTILEEFSNSKIDSDYLENILLEHGKRE